MSSTNKFVFPESLPHVEEKKKECSGLPGLDSNITQSGHKKMPYRPSVPAGAKRVTVYRVPRSFAFLFSPNS